MNGAEIQYRPWRALWVTLIALVAYSQCGWRGLALVLLVTFDIEVRP